MPDRDAQSNFIVQWKYKSKTRGSKEIVAWADHIWTFTKGHLTEIGHMTETTIPLDPNA